MGERAKTNTNNAYDLAGKEFLNQHGHWTVGVFFFVSGFFLGGNESGRFGDFESESVSSFGINRGGKQGKGRRYWCFFLRSTHHSLYCT